MKINASNLLIVISSLFVITTLITYAASRWRELQLKPLSNRKLIKILDKESAFVVNELALYLEAGAGRVATREVLRNIRDKEAVQVQIARKKIQKNKIKDEQIKLLRKLQDERQAANAP